MTLGLNKGMSQTNEKVHTQRRQSNYIEIIDWGTSKCLKWQFQSVSLSKVKQECVCVCVCEGRGVKKKKKKEVLLFST